MSELSASQNSTLTMAVGSFPDQPFDPAHATPTGNQFYPPQNDPDVTLLPPKRAPVTTSNVWEAVKVSLLDPTSTFLLFSLLCRPQTAHLTILVFSYPLLAVRSRFSVDFYPLNEAILDYQLAGLFASPTLPDPLHAIVDAARYSRRCRLCDDSVVDGQAW